MSEILLATCAALPDGEPGGHLLPAAYAAAGHTARWAVWDDPSVDWARADQVAVRAVWDYEDRLEEFLAWAHRVDGAADRLLNGAATFAWNTDKQYLVELLAAGVPVIPSRSVADRSGLAEAVAEHGRAVVKTRVGAGGRGVQVLSRGDDGTQVTDPGPWLVQPLLESVRTEGEQSVFWFRGEVRGQVAKRPAGEEIRVHPEYGGRSDVVPLTAEAEALTRAVVAAAEESLGRRLDYARADLLRLPGGQLAVGELEVTEPGLYLDLMPELAEVFVAATAPRA